MMKGKKRGMAVAAALAVLVLLSAACKERTSFTDQVARVENFDPLGKYDPPITVSWGVNSSSVQQFKNGDTYENNIWSRKYKEDLGINLTVGFSADGASGAYEQQITLGLAAGDLPDVLRVPSYRLFEEGAKAGLWADLSTVYDQYADDWMKMIKGKYPSAFEYATVDNRLYGVPPLNDNRQFAALLWIRDDWLKKLNLNAPATIEEMVDVARAFTFKDPDGNGKNDTYGLALNNRLVSADFASLLGIFSAFGVPAYTHIMYYRNTDEKMTFAYLDPAVKEVLRLVRQMYQEGLIDPEFSAKDVNKIADEIAQGRVGMEYGLQWNTWWPWNGLYANSGLTAHPYAIPVKDGYIPSLGHESNVAGGDITVISSKHKNPEVLIKMFNLYNRTVNPYMSDEIYATYDADEQYRFTPTWINEPQEPNYQPMLQAAFEKNTSDGMPTNLISRYNQILGFSNGTDTRTDAYGLWGQYSQEGSMYIIMNNYVPKGWLQESVLGAVWPQSLIDNDASLQKITEQAFTEIIMGTRDIDYFDTYVQNWLRAGGQQVLNDLEAMYSK
jgi:putative aldouronate transport system substrate-binding protein